MASLQVPLAIWKGLIDYNVTSVLPAEKYGWLFIGMQSGRILRLNIHTDHATNDFKMKPAMLLVGHQSPIVAMRVVEQPHDQSLRPLPALLSLDAKGELALWSIDDGRCLLHNVAASEGPPTAMLISPSGEYAIILGHSLNATIIKVATLEVTTSIPLPNRDWIHGAALVRMAEGITGGNSGLCRIVLLTLCKRHLYSFLFEESIGRARCLPEPLNLSYPRFVPPPNGPFKQILAIGIHCCICDDFSVWILRLSDDNSWVSQPLWADPTVKIFKMLAFNETILGIQLVSSTVILVDLSSQVERMLELSPNSPLSSRLLCSWTDGFLLDLQLSEKQAKHHCYLIPLPLSKRKGGNPDGVDDTSTAILSIQYDDLQLSDQIVCSAFLESGGKLQIVHGLANGDIYLSDASIGLLQSTEMATSLCGVHRNRITMLRLLQDRFLSGDSSGLLAFWDLSTGKELGRIRGTFAAITAATIIPLLYALVDCDGSLILVDYETLAPIGLLPSRGHPVIRLQWSKNESRLLAIVYADGMINFWNLNTLQCERSLTLRAPGLEELLGSLECHMDVAVDGGFLSYQNEGLFKVVGPSLSWLPSLFSDPVQMLQLDVRRLVEFFKQLISTRPADQISQVQGILSLLLSLLLPWAIDEEIDGWAHRFGLTRPRANIVPGIIGANGNVSFLAPSSSAGRKKDVDGWWRLSSAMMASLCLAVSAVFELQFDFGEEWDRLRMAFNSRILTPPTPSPLCMPSFSFASKYWHDLSEEIRHAARLLILQTLNRFDGAALQAIVAYWTVLLPTVDNTKGRKMNRGAIILGILGAYKPESLSPPVRKMVAESLMAILMEEGRILFRPAAIELLGKGYRVWEPYVHGLSIFRILLRWLSKTSQVDDNGVIAQLVVPFEDATTLDMLDAVRGTLLKLATCAASSIIPTWLTIDFAAARTLVERWTTISLLSDLIRQRPQVLRPYVHLVAEVAVHMADSGALSGGASRQRTLSIAMPLILDLKNSYDFVAFNRDCARLAAASLLEDGRIYLFDLRGSSTRTLEGHSKSVTALDFSPDGRLLVSYSGEEATMRWWQVSGGLMGGILGGSIRPWRTVVVEPALTEAFLRYHPDYEPSEHDLGSGNGAREKLVFCWPNDQQIVQIMMDDEVVCNMSFPMS